VKNALVILGIITAALVGVFVPGPWDARAQHPTTVQHTPMQAEQRCTEIIVEHNWHAGDLCDTLPPAVRVSERQWRRYNRLNGWEWIGYNPYDDPHHMSGDCWYTRATTDVPWILCWDGTIMRTP